MQDLSHANLETAVVNVSTAPPEEGAPTMFCTQCGTRNGGDAKYCKQCGHKLDRVAPLRFSEEEFLLPESREEKVRSLLVAAYEKYEASDLDGAIATCAEALAIRPESTDAHSLLSTLYEKKGDRERAIAAREKVLDLNPGSIADREKLEELKEGQLSTTPKKITSSRRHTSSPLVESPAVQAFAALGVMLVVLAIGAAMLWIGRPNPRAAAASVNPDSNPTQAPTGSGQSAPHQLQPPVASVPQQAIAPVASGGAQAPNQANPAQGSAPTPNVISNYADAFNSPRRPSPERNPGPPLGTRQISPAPVNPQFDSSQGRLNAGAMPDPNAARDRGNTVRLPDEDPGSGQGAPFAANSATGASNQTQPPAAPPGRIEIIVSPGPPNGAGARNVGADPGSVDSRGALEVARDMNTRGDYKKAVTFYKKALDGAGDAAADIHQKMGLCYQRLGDKENAIQHYQQGIEAYKALIAAGKSVESAKNGIRACENGIKVCQ